jgi:hypothetical protein
MADSSYIICDTQNQQARPVKLHDNGGSGGFGFAELEVSPTHARALQLHEGVRQNEVLQSPGSNHLSSRRHRPHL